MNERWFPLVGRDNIPAVDSRRMKEVERLMETKFAIGIVRMMELAGRHLAHLTRERFLDGSPVGKQAVVLVGGGGNGGGALVCARRLAGWGASVTVFLAQGPRRMHGISAEQLSISRTLGVRDVERRGRPDALMETIEGTDVIIDGLIGYGLKAAPQGLVKTFIEVVASSASKVLAVDLPSGLDASTGDTPGVVVRAEATLTLALPKIGLYAPAARENVGDLYVADIGVPPALYAAPSLDLEMPPLFARSDILRVDY